MARRKRGSNSILIVTSAVLFLFGLAFLLFPERSFTTQVQVFSIASLTIGIVYMAFASTNASDTQQSHPSGDWPMIEGLMDILLGIVLIMSVNTAHTSLLLLFFAIWALTGAAARMFYAFKSQNAQAKRNGIILAAFCLMACAAFTLWVVFPDISLSVLVGAGLLLYAAGSFRPPRRRSTKS